jgi:hypothetical protein
VALPNISDGQIALDPLNRIFYYLDSNGNLVNSSLNLLQDSSTQISTEEDLIVSGNLTISGNTTIIESTVTTVKDPIMTLGGKTAPTVDDNKDRGIEFRWHDGTSAKLGFFGFDDSSGKFTFIPDATNTSEVFSGTIGELAAKIDWDNILNKPTLVNSITGTPNEVDVSSSTGAIIISLPSTIAVNITGSAAGWTTPRKITLAGDLEGNVTIDGSANVTLTANVVANAVQLGENTTGDYVANLTAGTGITITSGTGEQSQPIIAVTNNTYDAYGAAATAESNAATDASTKAATAYSNATIYTNNQLALFEVDDLADVTINTSIANSYLKFNGTAWINDLVDLSTDTTGNYVQSLVAGTGITISNNSGEGSTPTITANVSLDNLNDVSVALAGNGQLLAFDGNTNTWVAKSALDLTIPTGVQYTEVIGNGSDVEFTITHGLTTDEPFVVVMKKNASNNFEAVNALWEVSSNTQVKVYFETPPASGDAKVLVFGDVSTASIVISSLDQLPDVITGSASAGDVLYRDGGYWVSHALYLNDMADVQGTNSAVANQFLKYNGSAWVGSTINEIQNISDIADVTISSAANGEVLMYNGSAWVNSTFPTSEPTGIENKADSTISLSGRVFTIAPVSTSYTVWCKGKRYVKTTSSSVTITDQSGLHYIYFSNTGALTSKFNTFFDFENEAPVAYVYWNSGGNTHHFFADERHGIVLDWATHEYLHRTRGAAIASGFGITVTTGGDGTSNTHAQVSLAGGTFFDEDLEVQITDSASPTPNTWEQTLSPVAQIPMFYRSGSAWVKDAATDYPLKHNGGRAMYNLNTAGTWSTPQIDNNRWGISWIVATNNINEPVIAILGQENYTSTNLAEDAVWEDLDLTGFPIYEFRPLHKIVYYTSNTYTNEPQAAVTSVWDLRRTLSTVGSIPSTPISDHGSMTGLGDDDHTQYFNSTRHDAHDHSAVLNSAVLADLGDVASNIPSTGQFLKWNGTSWVPDSIPTINSLDDVGDVSATGAATGSVLVYNGSAWVGTIDPTVGGNLTVTGNLVVNGNTVTINTETITVEDKTIELGTAVSPSNTTADGAGIVVPDGSANKSFTWSNATSAWSSSESLNLASGKVIKIAGTQVLSATNYTGEAATVAANSVTATILQEGPPRAGFRSQISTVTTTPYVLQVSDLAKLVLVNGSTGMTVTIPTEANVAFTTGDRIDVTRYGSGAVTFAAQAGVTMRYTPGVNLRAVYSTATLTKIGTNEWLITGDLAA